MQQWGWKPSDVLRAGMIVKGEVQLQVTVRHAAA